MPRLITTLMVVIATGGAILASSATVSANWITIRNDTTTALIIQETVIVKGSVKHGKPTNLLPGETLREFLPGASTKRIEIFESRQPNRTVWSGQLECQAEIHSFSVASVAGKVTVTSVSQRRK